MPPKKRVEYTQEQMQNACLDVQRGMGIRPAARKHGVPASTLGKHYKSPETKVGAGRKTFLSQEAEDLLVRYLLENARCGYGYTKDEVLRFVKDFVQDQGVVANDIWMEKGPGVKWFKLFLKRHPEISIRKGECLSSQRVRGADPFVIKNFYDDLKNEYEKALITGDEDAYLIYNCDETNFIHDPKDVKLLAPKGMKRVSKHVAGSGKANTTVLACCAADGSVMPPFIIFTGKYVWSSWMCANPYPGTAYAAQEKGWMDGITFEKWFQTVFVANIPPKDERTKAVILIYDGLKCHTSYKVSRIAVENNISLVKLPPNMTHYMQPLDKTVFKPLKSAWNKQMIDFNRKNPGKSLSNSEFSENIKILWQSAFSPDIVKSGFSSTGILPINWTKVPREAYDQYKWERFEVQQSEPALPIELPNINVGNIDSVVGSTSAQKNFCSQSLAKTSELRTGQLSEQNKENLNFSLNQDCQDESTSRTSTPKSDAICFEQFIRRKLSENLSYKQLPEKPKRVRLTTDIGHIVTSDEAMKILKEKETAKQKKGDKFKKKINGNERITVLSSQKKKRNQKKRKLSSSSSESNVDLSLGSEIENESFSDLEEDFLNKSNPKIDLENYYAIYYDERWYIGRTVAINENKTYKIKFLKEDIDTFYWDKDPEFQDVDEKFIFYGPIKLLGNGPFSLEITDLNKINSLYKTIKHKSN